MAFLKRAAEIWRDFNATLNPLSGAYPPAKADIRAWGKTIEDSLDALAEAAGFDPTNLSERVDGVATDLAEASGRINTEVDRATVAETVLRTDLTAETDRGVDTVRAARRTPANPRYAYLDDGSKSLSVVRTALVTHLYPFAGQSLCEGAQPTDTDGPFVTAPPLRNRVLMPSIGVRMFDASRDGSATEGQYFHDTAEMVEAVDGSGLRESPCAGFGYHLAKLMSDAFPGVDPAALPKIASYVSARGGYTLSRLNRGSKAYRYLLRGVQMMVDAEARRGRRVVVPAINWVQGEGDTANIYYNAENLEILRRRYEEDIRSITGQVEPVLLFLAQTNYVAPGVSVAACQVQLSQLEAAQRFPSIKLVGPLYPFEMEIGSNAASAAIHRSSRGTNGIGQMFARRVMEEMCGAGAPAFAPVDVRFLNATTIRARYRVPVLPLVLDTSGAVIRTAGMATTFGFDLLPADPVADTDGGFAASRVPIAGVAAYGGDSVDITLSAAPTARELTVAYALRRDTPGGSDGPVSGARGCVRDSAAHVSIIDGTTHRNWSVAWCRRIRTFA